MSRIELKDVSVVFSQGKRKVTAVDSVSFVVESGEIFGIVGFSGAGKSTLIRTLNLLQPPTSGEVLINGVDITKENAQALRNTRQHIGMIFQHFNLIENRTIEQNIEFALKAVNYPKAERKKRVTDLLKLVDLSDKLTSYPSNLSGGQKQRVGIARALANNPEILLCDEATSALDVETTEEILQLLKRINRELKITIVFITHELEVAKRLFDKIAVMEDGKIVELGETYEVFANPQTEITKKLVGRYLNLEIPPELYKQLMEDDGKLLELHYRGTNTLEPLISEVSKDFDVFVSITHGKIEYINGKAIGVLLVYVTGPDRDKKLAIERIRQNVTSLREISLEDGG